MSKLANVLFAKELQRRLLASSSSIISLAVNPGVVATQSSLNMLWFISWLSFAWDITPVNGAASSLFAATSPLVRANADVYRGAYLAPFGVLGESSEVSQNPELGKKLWEASEKVVEGALANGGGTLGL